VEDCRAWIGLARDLGARGVKVRPNGLRKDVPPEATYEQIGRALRACGEAAGDAGVEIWVEVHGAETQKPTAMRAIMDHCGHKSVGVCWNSNKTDKDENGSIRAAFDLLRPNILSCHIVDLWGDYPYRELFGLFRETGYDRFTLCEVGTAMDPNAGTVFLKCYRGLWGELRR
jgi:sugar phosphate isomerase/epimerase